MVLLFILDIIIIKKNKYIEEDESTHEKSINIGDALKSDLDFIKSLTNLFCSYAYHPNIFPVEI